MRRALTLLVTATVLAAIGAAPADARTRPVRYAQQAFDATNVDRRDNHLLALKPDDCLKHAAARQAKLMAQREQIFHQDLDTVVHDCGLAGAGENVAAGYPTGRSVVDDGWMSSEGHRANILDPSFTVMGIGARKGHNGQWYVAQVLGDRR